MERAGVVSSVILGFILAATAGLAQAEAREPVATATGEIAASEMRGEELPFPVGWLPEAELAAFPHEIGGPAETGALPEPAAPGFELKGIELPFPVGWVPEAELAAFPHEIGGPAETGALPEPAAPVFELKGTELPFPVGWVPE